MPVSKTFNFVNLKRVCKLYTCRPTVRKYGLPTNLTKNIRLKNNEEQEFLSKILYNDVLKDIKKNNERNEKSKVRNFTNLTTHTKPICLSYLTPETDTDERQTNATENETQVDHSQYITKIITEANSDSSKAIPLDVENFTPSDNVKTTSPNKWPREVFMDKSSNLVNDRIDNIIRLGTSNPSIPDSNTPCGGCGALLQCNDSSAPGFIPCEVFEYTSKRKLKSELCQRCYFLKEFNVALGVNVSAEEYPMILSQIKQHKALAIIMVDLFDFPCSIWPGILELIGDNDVIVVGNKIDLFIQEDNLFEVQIKSSLKQSLVDRGLDLESILDIVLISGKTGYNVERLVTSISRNWDAAGDIYLIGCTNVGKSTLFNCLLKSDLCRIEAEEILKRATVSSWPGTTLNLLKFPTKKIYKNLVYERAKRRIRENREKGARMKFKGTKSGFTQNTLTEPVTRTKIQMKIPIQCEFTSGYNAIEQNQEPGLDPKDSLFASSKWFHDTPGVIQQDQITNFLTRSELTLTLPEKLIQPRSFLLSPGKSLFLGGVARVDFDKGSETGWFTVFASKHLPITITSVDDAEYVYNNLLGTNLFCVPQGGKERLSKWPEMKSKKLKICGSRPEQVAGDIVLSSAGWISVVLEPAFYCEVTVWTPEGKGIYLRDIPVIRKSPLLNLRYSDVDTPRKKIKKRE
ncbi:hypothetical protein RUM44_001081 [Polyplax serrata]|uniref:G domain-containing protein n=1 Tax=Polyplax serrata TaxID=468196 RepID=A0ABR1B6M1_POLSC